MTQPMPGAPAPRNAGPRNDGRPPERGRLGGLVLALAGSMLVLALMLVAAVLPLFTAAQPCPIDLQPCGTEAKLPVLALLMMLVPFVAWLAGAVGVVVALFRRKSDRSAPRLQWLWPVWGLGILSWVAGLTIWFIWQ